MLVPAAAAAAAVVISAVLLWPAPEPPESYENDFTFYDIEAIREGLAKAGMRLSAPTAITDSTRDQYCTYFDAGGARQRVSYCTTTALEESGVPVGNINIGGDAESGPVMAVALVDSDSLDPGRAAAVFEVMVRELVCDCWEERRPGGFATVSEWVSEARDQFAGSGRDVPLKSRITGLDNKDLVLEVSEADGAYLWALVIAK